MARHRNAELFCNYPEGFRKRHFFDLLHELEYVATGVTAEAVKNLFLSMNGKRRCFFGVKRAKAL